MTVPVSADDRAPEESAEIPALYVACPLTGLKGAKIRLVDSQVAAIKHAIHAVTTAERPDDDAWPVSVYAPIDHTSPWKAGELSAHSVYSCNLDRVHASDALIVLGENGGSAGVGQELEWAVRLALPVLYLGPECVSRQVEGVPGVECRTYNNDIETLELHVKNFVRQMRHRIAGGPSRRRSRRLRYEALRLRLLAAWQGASDRTEVAARCGLDLHYVALVLQNPALVAMLPVDAVLDLAGALDMPLDPYLSDFAILPASAMRALVRAAEHNAWPDELVDRLVLYGLASIAEDAGLDLDSISTWERLADDLRG